MKSKPKSVVIVGSAYPLRGGLANYNERLARAYQDQGAEVKIYTFSLQYPNFLFPGKTQYAEGPAPEGLDIEVSLNSVNPFSWIRLGRKIKKRSPDLLIIKFWIPFMGPSLGTVARIAKRNGKTKVVTIIDNIIPHEKRPGDRILANYFVGAVDGFISMSESVLEDFNTFDQKKPKIFTPHPVYDNFGQPKAKHMAKQALGLDANQNYILFFGFIRDYKGLDLLLRAMSDPRIREMGLKLIIAGEFYTDSKPYYDIIEQYQLQEVLILATDFIPDDKVGDYFNAADMVVQPYKDATQSGVTQIAYHFEKPMLVTNVGGLPEIVPHLKTGYVVDVDPLKIADGIVDFYENNREQAMIENCREEKKKYSWETMLEKIGEL